ncbi:hypothetical protein ACLOJK_039175, partial [Asimina triloba]
RSAPAIPAITADATGGSIQWPEILTERHPAGSKQQPEQHPWQRPHQPQSTIQKNPFRVAVTLAISIWTNHQAVPKIGIQHRNPPRSDGYPHQPAPSGQAASGDPHDPASSEQTVSKASFKSGQSQSVSSDRQPSTTSKNPHGLCPLSFQQQSTQLKPCV